MFYLDIGIDLMIIGREGRLGGMLARSAYLKALMKKSDGDNSPL